MNLRRQPSFPHRRRYVIKLRDDAEAVHGKLVGKLENIVSGQQFDFETDEQLIALLLADLRTTERTAPASDADLPGETGD